MPPRLVNGPVELPREVQLKRIVSLTQAAALLGVSVDTVKRRYSAKIVTLSPRRKGMRLDDALLLAGPEAELLLSSGAA